MKDLPLHNERIWRAMAHTWATCMEISQRVRRMGGKESPQACSARIRENRLVYGIDYRKRLRAGTRQQTWEYRLAK